MRNEIAGIRAPDSRLAAAATEMAREASSPLLFNHVMRSYFFAELMARARAPKYDRELVYLGAVMHDLGLTDRFLGAERFEVDGANAARHFLEQWGLTRQKTALVWDAIALHSTVGIASHKEPEVALVHLGISVDVVGFGFADLPRGDIDQIIAAYPRLNFKKDFLAMLADIAARKPQSAFGNFLSDVGKAQVHGFECPDFCSLMESAPFAE